MRGGARVSWQGEKYAVALIWRRAHHVLNPCGPGSVLRRWGFVHHDAKCEKRMSGAMRHDRA